MKTPGGTRTAADSRQEVVFCSRGGGTTGNAGFAGLEGRGRGGLGEAGGGLVTAGLPFLCTITLAVFAVVARRAGRWGFWTTAAGAATSLLGFQTCLNVFGAVDILPFTGVTLPFVSNGGSSMLSAWGMLAFLKATDTRQNASFAVRLPSRRELRGEVD